jgi:triacylglycerol esterase/lipase EstA (alpha/beta hydrolase family)
MRLALPILVGVVSLLTVGCATYVSFSYVVAFAKRPRPPRILRAILVEILTTLVLLPFWPLWMIVGATYEVEIEGEGRATGKRNPVILLHGFAMNQTQWLWMGSRLARRGIGPLYGTSYFSPQSVRRSGRHLRDFVERVCAREDVKKVDIVAHSLGGVVARYYIEQLGGDARVGRLVTIGSPHRGTVLGRFGPLLPSAREVADDSEFIAALGHPKPDVKYTSVWSRADAVIIPADSSSIAPAGEDRVFDDIGHLTLLLSPRVIDCVAERLKA